MKKLPISKILLFFLFIFFTNVYSNDTYAIVKDPSSDCYYPSNLGTANEETVALGAPTAGGVIGNMCNYALPSDWIDVSTPEKFARRNICFVGTRCITGGSGSDPKIKNGEKIYFYGSSDNTVTGSLNPNGGSYSGGGTDRAYATLAECQSANPNRVTRRIPVVGGYATDPTIEECRRQAGSGYTPNSCTTDQKNWLFYQTSQTQFRSYSPEQEAAMRTSVMNCFKSGNVTQEFCLAAAFGAGASNNKIFRCKCTVPVNLQCSAGVGCEEVCSLVPSGFADLVKTTAPTPQSPMAFIQVIANFVFYLAIFIFVINFIYAGFLYVRSSGEEDKLKEAHNRLNNSIAGLVFIILIGALLNYVVGILASSGLR